jgi:outer membrane PBP1 activator LpoA protein
MGTKKGQTGTVYRIVTRSALGDRYASCFDGMRVESTEGRMVLTGEVEDLDGLLKCINDLGLKLLSVQILSQEAR